MAEIAEEELPEEEETSQRKRRQTCPDTVTQIMINFLPATSSPVVEETTPEEKQEQQQKKQPWQKPEQQELLDETEKTALLAMEYISGLAFCPDRWQYLAIHVPPPVLDHLFSKSLSHTFITKYLSCSSVLAELVAPHALQILETLVDYSSEKYLDLFFNPAASPAFCVLDGNMCWWKQVQAMSKRAPVTFVPNSILDFYKDDRMLTNVLLQLYSPTDAGRVAFSEMLAKTTATTKQVTIVKRIRMDMVQTYFDVRKH